MRPMSSSCSHSSWVKVGFCCWETEGVVVVGGAAPVVEVTSDGAGPVDVVSLEDVTSERAGVAAEACPCSDAVAGWVIVGLNWDMLDATSLSSRDTESLLVTAEASGMTGRPAYGRGICWTLV